MKRIYPIARYFYPNILKIWIKEIKGLENLPRNGAFILAGNHSSYLDGPMIPCIVMPYFNKKVHFLVDSSYFKGIVGWFLNYSGCIPIGYWDHPERKKKNMETIEMALGYLKKGEIVGIFPEGARSKDGKLKEGKPGVARLALRSKVPVVPFGIMGSYETFPKGSYMPKMKKSIIIRFGRPIRFNEFYKRGENTKTLNAVVRKVMTEIGRLIGQDYRF